MSVMNTRRRMRPAGSMGRIPEDAEQARKSIYPAVLPAELADVAEGYPKQVYCEICGAVVHVVPLKRLVEGWPQCCDQQMRLKY